MPENFQKNRWSRSPEVESPSKFSCEIVLKHQKEICSEVEPATSSNVREK